MLKEGPALPDWKKDSRTARRDSYKKMINDVLANASRLLTPRSVVWIRTDAREFTKEVTLNAIRNIWPNRKLFMRNDNSPSVQLRLNTSETCRPEPEKLIC